MQWLISLIAGTGGPLSWIANLILNFFWGKAAAAIAADQKDKASHQAEVDQAAQDMQKTKDLKPESTEKEVDDAIDDSLSHF